MHQSEMTEQAIRQIKITENALAEEYNGLLNEIIDFDYAKKMYEKYILKPIADKNYLNSSIESMALELARTEIKRLAQYINYLDNHR